MSPHRNLPLTTCVLVLALACALVVPATAQRITGGITGTVQDTQGLLITGATVLIQNDATGYQLELKTSAQGEFTAPDLKPDVYRIMVNAPGFAQFKAPVTVRVGVTTPLKVVMSVQASTVEMTVEATAVAVDTTKATVQGVITGDRIADIPLNGRNFLDLASQEPGVQVVDGGSFDPTKNQMTGISVGGRTGRTTRIQVDGVDITDETVGTTVANISNESIQEFGISQASLDPATDMTSSGAVNIVTKSGGNTFHGDGFINMRDARFAADQRLDKTAPTTKKPPFDRQIWGGSLGGPILKNKLFFHASAEFNNTDSQRFTALPEFPQYSGSFNSPMDERMLSGRLDWNINNQWHAFYRFNHNYNIGVTGFGDRDLQAFSNLNNTNIHVGGFDYAAGNWTHQIRFSYVNFNNFIVDADKLAGTPVTLDPSGKPLDVYIRYTLWVGSDYLAPQSTFQDNKQTKYDGAWIRGKHTFRFGAEMNKIVQAGIFNFWGNGPRIRGLYNDSSIAYAAGDPFGPGGAENPLNFPLNQIIFGNGLGYGSERPAMSFPRGGFFNNRWGLYFQDSVKLMPNFTMNYGVRWAYNSGIDNGDLERAPLFAQFSPALSGKPTIPKNDFGPQLGIAWDPRGNGRTVIRAGAGIFYDTVIFNSISFDRLINLPPGFANETPTISASNPTLKDPRTGGVLYDFTPFFETNTALGSVISVVQDQQAKLQAISKQLAASWPQPGVPVLADSYGGTYGNSLIDPRFKTPYSMMFNVGVQHEIRDGLVLSVDYVRNRGARFTMTRDLNRLGAANSLTNSLPYTRDPSAYNYGMTNYDLALDTINYVLARCGVSTVAETYTTGCSATAPASSWRGKTLDITNFASYGLDSGSGIDGYAFAGQNPNFTDMTVIQPIGLSLYRALQVRLTGKIGSFGPFKNLTTNINYALSRFESTGGGDQDFLGYAWDNDHPTKYFGPANMDRTHMFGITFTTGLPLGFKVSTTNSLRTAYPTTMQLPSGSSTGAGEIFFTDLNGDGTTIDELPGTNRGAFGRTVKAADLNKWINNFNSTYAGTITPAGQALIDAGLMTADDLRGLGAVVQPLTAAPAHNRGNPNFINTDMRLSRPIKIRERVTIEPQVDIFNLFNVANYESMITSELNGQAGSPNGTVSGVTPLNGGLGRVGSGSGSFAPGTQRALQFNVRVTF